jgi:tetratricopeptide (TPR) repeat protein
MLAFYLLCPARPALAATAGQAAPSTAAAPGSPDPDALYRQRQNLDAARQAVTIWASRAAGGKDFESAWKLARSCYWIGTHGVDAERRAALEQGVKAGEQAAALEPKKPDGHFWMAANMGALAESYGLRQGLKYRGRIKEALETVLKIDPAWQQGSADRALGRWYFKVPGLFGGSDAMAEEHLRKALAYNPQSTATLYFLAEVLVDRNRKDEARTMLERALAAAIDPEWAAEDADFQRQAREMLKKIK